MIDTYKKPLESMKKLSGFQIAQITKAKHVIANAKIIQQKLRYNRV